jgi:hypothetical protein
MFSDTLLHSILQNVIRYLNTLHSVEYLIDLQMQNTLLQFNPAPINKEQILSKKVSYNPHTAINHEKVLLQLRSMLA